MKDIFGVISHEVTVTYTSSSLKTKSRTEHRKMSKKLLEIKSSFILFTLKKDPNKIL